MLWPTCMVCFSFSAGSFDDLTIAEVLEAGDVDLDVKCTPFLLASSSAAQNSLAQLYVKWGDRPLQPCTAAFEGTGGERRCLGVKRASP